MIYAFSRWKDDKKEKARDSWKRERKNGAREVGKARGFSKVHAEQPLLPGFCDSLGLIPGIFLELEDQGSSLLIGFSLAKIRPSRESRKVYREKFARGYQRLGPR